MSRALWMWNEYEVTARRIRCDKCWGVGQLFAMEGSQYKLIVTGTLCSRCINRHFPDAWGRIDAYVHAFHVYLNLDVLEYRNRMYASDVRISAGIREFRIQKNIIMSTGLYFLYHVNKIMFIWALAA